MGNNCIGVLDIWCCIWRVGNFFILCVVNNLDFKFWGNRIFWSVKFYILDIYVGGFN